MKRPQNLKCFATVAFCILYMPPWLLSNSSIAVGIMTALKSILTLFFLCGRLLNPKRNFFNGSLLIFLAFAVSIMISITIQNFFGSKAGFLSPRSFSFICLALFYDFSLSLSRAEVSKSLRLIGYYITLINLPSAMYLISFIFGAKPSWTLESIGDYAIPYRVYSNFVYFNSHVFFDFGGWAIGRLNGIFFEPGLLGTICALLLIAMHSLRKLDTLSGFFLTLYGILSFSTAFVVILGGYFLLLNALYFINANAAGKFRISKNNCVAIVFICVFALIAISTAFASKIIAPILFERFSEGIGKFFSIRSFNFSRDGSVQATLSTLTNSMGLDFWFGYGVENSPGNVILNLASQYGVLSLFFGVFFLLKVCGPNIGARQVRIKSAALSAILMIASYQLILGFYHPLFLLSFAILQFSKDSPNFGRADCVEMGTTNLKPLMNVLKSLNSKQTQES